jgi:hypothetical protein
MMGIAMMQRLFTRWPLLAALLGAALALHPASTAAQTPPASYYGVASAGDRVEARYNGTRCTDATTGANGFWSLTVTAGGGCGVVEGGTLAFFRNGVDSGARETFHSGGVPASITSGVNVGGGALQPVPAPPALAGAAAFSGRVPVAETASLLVTARDLSTETLRAALSGAGCRLQALAVLRDGRWLIYIEGAPAQVNAAFPSLLSQTSPFYVRC